jgi:hypothetical protein
MVSSMFFACALAEFLLAESPIAPMTPLGALALALKRFELLDGSALLGD